MSDQLDTYGVVRLDAAGRGVVTLTPAGMLSWHVTRMAVRTTQTPSQIPVPQCTVYLNSIADGNIVDQTYSGSRDTSDCDLKIQHGSNLIFLWENGVPLSTATASIYGTQDLQGR